MTDQTVHGVKAPLQAPAKQAAQLVDLALEHQAPPESREDAIRYVRAHIAEDVAENNPRLWMVEGYEQPMTGGDYSAVVLYELDRLAR